MRDNKRNKKFFVANASRNDHACNVVRHANNDLRDGKEEEEKARGN